MFSCCLPTCRGSGFRKAKKKSLFSDHRHWLGPHLHCLWPFVRRSPQSYTQDVVEELVDGFGYSVSLDRGQLHCATINNQGCSELEGESNFCLTAACRMHALQAGTMDHLSESLVPAFPGRVICSDTTSMSHYLVFSSSHRVLDQLFPRSCPPSIPCEALIHYGSSGSTFSPCEWDDSPQDQLKIPIYLMLGSWLDQGQDFREPLQFSCWMLSLATGHISFGGSDLEGHAYLLPGHMEPLKTIEPEQKEPAPKLLPHPEPEPEPEPEPAPGLEPAPAPAPQPVAELEPVSTASDPTELEEGPPLTAAPVPAPELEPTGPWAVTTENQLREDKPNLLDFPPKLVADQLARMEAASIGSCRAEGSCLPVPLAAPHLPFPDPECDDLGPYSCSPVTNTVTWALSKPQALAVPMCTAEPDTKGTCCMGWLCR
ncbi:ral guanine nucleotide dissociation stimulator [Equus caballus]|uniref:ral guanine nucleotide dissociation stimulator n=1 Tax=Equus caballus TaxID=9796 RepID=UPI0038B34832